MKLKPVFTEKSLEQAKKGKYTFRVDRTLNKFEIKKLVEEIFSVTVVKVHKVKIAGTIKKTVRGKKKIIKPKVKAIVSLKEKDKIDLFEEEKKGKKTK